MKRIQIGKTQKNKKFISKELLVCKNIPVILITKSVLRKRRVLVIFTRCLDKKP